MSKYKKFGDLPKKIRKRFHNKFSKNTKIDEVMHVVSLQNPKGWGIQWNGNGDRRLLERFLAAENTLPVNMLSRKLYNQLSIDQKEMFSIEEVLDSLHSSIAAGWYYGGDAGYKAEKKYKKFKEAYDLLLGVK